MCCLRLAANTGRKKVAKNRHLGTIAQLCPAISSHVSTIGKNLLSSNISSTCFHNMVNFGPLAADILSLVWGAPANFNGVEQRAPLIIGRATITLGIGPHSSLFIMVALRSRCGHYILPCGCFFYLLSLSRQMWNYYSGLCALRPSRSMLHYVKLHTHGTRT